MIELIVIRHGATDWTPEHRLQGRRDVELSEDGRAQVAQWTLPRHYARHRWCTSPLLRARQTASLLGAQTVVSEPRIIEMDWGGWEGRTLNEIRTERGADMVADEALGLDLRPPDGESPRDVCERLRPWLEQLGNSEEDWIAVTHKGVIRALLALATGWDKRTKPPQKMRWECAEEIDVERNGDISLGAANVALAPSASQAHKTHP